MRAARPAPGRVRAGGLRAMVAAAALAATPALAQAPADPDSLAGLWASETHYGPALRGELTVSRRGEGWHAAIAGAGHDFRARPGDVRFSLPDGRGGFRGRLAEDGRSISGFWLQPAGETTEPPFATPLVLDRVAPGVWRGTVVPLPDRFTLYLKVFPEGDSLVGAFRNPELNVNGGASQYHVTRSGDSVRFIRRYEGGEIRHAAAFLRAPDRLRIAWPRVGTVELTRRTPAQAAAFFPRPPGEPPYVYRRPPEVGDGWETAPAGEVGLDQAALERLVRRIAASDPTARPPQLIHSLLVARRGKLVLEEYFFGHDRETPHDVRSAGKTFASVLLGAARLRGVRISPETRITDVLRARGPFANPDPRKDRVTLAHPLTHTAGLACDDNDDASPGNEGTLWRQEGQPDFWKYTLDLPMAHDPGRRYAYCSANINLAGGALATATGTWLPELFDREVARPLQFDRYHWNLAPNGEGYLGGGAFLRPRDLLKVGQAYLDGGVWRGRRIVDAAWIRRSTTPLVEINEATTGLSPEDFGNFYGHGQDALAWHMSTLSHRGRRYFAYAATGNGGQILLVVPELELTVVFTGGNYMQGFVWGRWGPDIVGGEIIPAIRD
jgi:CubicO group peptidase (beta-lactamase class C family)